MPLLWHTVRYTSIATMASQSFFSQITNVASYNYYADMQLKILSLIQLAILCMVTFMPEVVHVR